MHKHPVLKKTKGETVQPCLDAVAEEIRLVLLRSGTPLTEFYCLPADLKELAAGYLYAEGFARADGSFFLGEPIPTHDGYVLSVDAARVPEAPCVDLAPTWAAGRGDLLLPDNSCIHWDRVMEYADALLGASAAFRATGCIHAAALCRDGRLCYLGEDISRFHALFKVLGKALLAGETMSDFVLCTTGRLPLPYVRRVIRSGIGCIISRSAPTEGALALARRFGLSLFGFARGDKATYYTQPLACCLLAGGDSRRVDGADKALLIHDGESFAQRVFRAMEPESECLLSYNRGAGPIRAMLEPLCAGRRPLRVLPDAISGVGPLGGIYTALLRCDSAAVLFAPCDLPFYHQSVATACRVHFTGLEDAVVFVADGGVQPLCGIYAKSCLPIIEQLLAQKTYRLRELLSQLRVTYLDAAALGLDTAYFTNINTQRDYETI